MREKTASFRIQSAVMRSEGSSSGESNGCMVKGVQFVEESSGIGSVDDITMSEHLKDLYFYQKMFSKLSK